MPAVHISIGADIRFPENGQYDMHRQYTFMPVAGIGTPWPHVVGHHIPGELLPLEQLIQDPHSLPGQTKMEIDRAIPIMKSFKQQQLQKQGLNNINSYVMIEINLNNKMFIVYWNALDTGNDSKIMKCKIPDTLFKKFPWRMVVEMVCSQHDSIGIGLVRMKD